MITVDGVSLVKLVLASCNRHKFEEFRQLLAPLHVELLFGGDYEHPLHVSETGKSFTENAALKAAAWAEYTGLPAISDDSGIEVRALNWQPGIYSSRVGGEDDEQCRQWLIRNMADKKDRYARYAAALVLVFPDGSNGFGYDPLFIPEGYSQTFGELSPEIKSKLSHRAKASKAFIKMLREKMGAESA